MCRAEYREIVLDEGTTWKVKILLKELRHEWRIFRKIAIFLSNSSFTICLNLPESQPSLFLFGLLLLFWCFSTLVILRFPSIQNNELKYRDSRLEVLLPESLAHA